MAVEGSITCLDVGEYCTVTQAAKRLSRYEDFISKETGSLFRSINLSVLSTLIALFGICTNAINMIVFYRQGFSSNTNISFFALALSDMGCLITAQWFAIAFNPYIEAANFDILIEEVQYLTGGWFHVCFCRITSWITVFITAERCLGITLPLKVKQIITLRLTTVVVLLIFAINLFTLIPEYVVVYLDWKFIPAKNRSLLGLVYRSYKDQAFGLVYSLTGVSGIISFIFVILLTTFLVTKMSQISKWRKKATGGSDKDDTVSGRDKKIIMMVVMIATVLIVCNIPGTALLLASLFVPEFMIGEALANTLFAFWSLAFACETINSSVNVFVYYRMSTKYRLTFIALFASCMKTKSPLSVTAPKPEQTDESVFVKKS